MFKNKKQNGKEKYWKEHIRRQESGELNIKAYCTENSLKYETFRSWRKKLTRVEVKDLVKVPLANPSLNLKQDEAIELIINNTLKLKIPASFNQENLSKVLQILGVL